MSLREPVRRRRAPEIHVLRLLPRPSPMQRLWAGTKMIGVVVLAVMMAVRPTWPTLGVAAFVVAVGVIVARVPAGAVPRLPRWVWVLLALGVLFDAQSGAHPLVHVGGVAVSLGGIERWLLLLFLGVVLLAAAMLVGWTTPLGEIAPALSRLVAPLRLVRLPVDEWVVGVGLAIRCLPLLIDEIRTLIAVRRLRRRRERPRSPRAALRANVRAAQDMLTGAIVVALRRARDLSDAMDARGGFAPPPDPARPRWVDAGVLALLGGVLAVALML